MKLATIIVCLILVIVMCSKKIKRQKTPIIQEELQDNIVLALPCPKWSWQQHDSDSSTTIVKIKENTTITLTQQTIENHTGSRLWTA